MLDFNGKSSHAPELSHWKVKKDGGDFDQFAGATITPRAVVNQVRRVLEFVDAHRDELFQKNTAITSEATSTISTTINANTDLKNTTENHHE